MFSPAKAEKQGAVEQSYYVDAAKSSQSAGMLYYS